MKRAEEANEEIERNKAILKEHKISRDRKKTEIKNNLADMLEALDSFDRLTCERSSEIEELQGGVDNLADFDQFILYF